MNGSSLALSPTIGGFQDFVTNVMQIPVAALPLGSLVVTYSFDFALDWVTQVLCLVGGQPGAYSMYTRAVYNLAADTLINFATDQSGQCFFSDLRKSYGCNSFVPGVISATSDEGTSVSYQVADSLKNLTVANLQNLKTPYGRMYLGIVQSLGPTSWGLS